MNTFKDFIIVIKLQAEGSVAGLVTCNTHNVTCNTHNVPSTLLVQTYPIILVCRQESSSRTQL
jgi:hypothetical protein